MARNEQKKIYYFHRDKHFKLIIYILSSQFSDRVNNVNRAEPAFSSHRRSVFSFFAEYPFLLYVCSSRLWHSELKLIKSQKIIVHKMYSRAINFISDNENRIINNEMNK